MIRILEVFLVQIHFQLVLSIFYWYLLVQFCYIHNNSYPTCWVSIFYNKIKYFLEEFISKIEIPVVFIVISKQELSSVKISNSPDTIIIIWTEITNSTFLTWWDNFQMCSFINFLISNTMKINSLNKQKFLFFINKQITLSFEYDILTTYWLVILLV